MLTIAITLPNAICGEAALIGRLLAQSVDIIHLRKPDADIDYCREILEQLTDAQRRRVVIHNHYELYEEYGLRGVHLNSHIMHLPDTYRGSRTRSCHSFEEVIRYKEGCDYLFLSPIFDSISKSGYRSAFTDEALQSASDRGIIDHRVIALGGVTPDKREYLKSLNFGGMAMSGALFGNLPL